jgi:hypothetical protein
MTSESSGSKKQKATPVSRSGFSSDLAIGS